MRYFYSSIPCTKTSQFSGGGFTLVELIVVVVIIGIMGVFAAPRFVGSGAVDELGAARETGSLLRLQQQRAMQNTALSCYGVNLASTSIAPTTCGPANAVAQSINAASGQIFTITPATPSLYFNGLGCAVTTPGAECDDVDRQLDFVGGDFRSLCIGGQGYIREGVCP